MNKIVITGAGSGIGAYLFRQMGGTCITRDFSTESWKRLEAEGVGTIIHCAVNSIRDITSENLYDYMDDNVFLTQRLLLIPHHKFIYFSSADVYSQSNPHRCHNESGTIGIDQTHSLYALTKLISEGLVKKYGCNWTILRPTNLLGRDSRKNSNLHKLLYEQNPVLSLTPDSEWNFVLHKDVESFIKICIREDLTGTYNLASSSSIRVSEVAAILKKEPEYGKFKYSTGNVDNTKAIAVLPVFSRHSIDVIKEFISQLKTS